MLKISLLFFLFLVFNDVKVIGKKYSILDKTLDNDITNIPKDTKPDQISQRTKDFVSDFELLLRNSDDRISGFFVMSFSKVA